MTVENAAHGVAHRDELAHRHHLARRTAHAQLQQGVEIAVPLGGQLDHRPGGVLALVVQVGRGLAGQACAQRGDDGGLRHPEQGGLAPIDEQQLARRLGNARVAGRTGRSAPYKRAR